MKAILYNQEGKETGEVSLPKEIFQIPLNSDLVHQVVISQMANKRKVIAHTKTRSEVRGGGRKPWKQKGTGRARHGSIRSPLWKGGGVTFGPTNERVFTRRIPKKMRRKALFMVLSEKLKNNVLIFLDKLAVEEPKTKFMAEILKKLPLKKGSTLIVLDGMDKKTILAARNIPNIKTIQAKELNCVDLLNFKYLIMSKDGVSVVKDTFLK